MDLIDLLPPNLGRVMRRAADALSVPLGGIVTTMLHLACTFSPTTFVASPGGGQIESVVENFLNVGLSGINKSGLTKIHEHVFTQTTKTIAAVVNDVECLLRNAIYVNRKDFPFQDSAATQAASIQKQCQHRNLTRIDDEMATSILNGNGGTVEIGAQHRLVVYNSPALMHR
jgi:hypothetical protein